MIKKIKILGIVVAWCLVGCQKQEELEVIGVSDRLDHIEKIIDDANSGALDSATFIYTRDGGAIYYSGNRGALHKTDLNDNLLWEYEPVLPINRYEGIDTIYSVGIEVEISNAVEANDGSMFFMEHIYEPYYAFNRNNSNIVQLIQFKHDSIVKLDKGGNLIWKIEHDWFNGLMIPTQDGGIVGYFSDYGVIRLKKLDIRGNSSWMKEHENHFPSGYYYHSGLGESIVQMADNSFLLTATKKRSDYPNTEEIKLLKTDENGNLTNATELYSFYDLGLDIVVANDGGALLVVSSWLDDSFQKRVLHIIRLDNMGNVEWQKYIEPVFLGKVVKVFNLLSSGYLIICGGDDVFADSGFYSVIKINNYGEKIE